TPKASEKGKAPNIQIQNPTPSHAGQEGDWEDDEYDKNEAIRVIHDMHRELTAIYQLWNPKSRDYPANPAGVLDLARNINAFINKDPTRLMPAAYPQIPKKPRHQQVPMPGTQTAPKK